MRSAALLAAVTIGGFVASPPPGLQVLRTSPSRRATPTSVVTVTFDRPVAGQLDGTIDARTVFSIAPAVAGTVEWRDPITLRFTPSGTLTPATTYTVTIANTLRAMDGTRLEQPYRFSFRVEGPSAIDGSPVNRWSNPRWLRPESEFDVLVSSPVELADAGRLARIELGRGCMGPSVITLTASGQRAVTRQDPDRYQPDWNGPPDPRTKDLRRVLHFKPDRPLPRDCAGELVLPSSFDNATGGDRVRWPFRTFGDFRLVSTTCTNSPRCPAGYIELGFSTPVKGADVLRNVRIAPDVRFTVDDTSDESDNWVLEAALRTRTRYQVVLDPDLRDVFGQPITGPRAGTLTTSGYAAGLEYPTGRMMIERESFRTLAVRHVNVDTLDVTTVAVPESLEARLLATPQWNLSDTWELLAPLATTRAVAVANRPDTPLVSAVRLPVYNAARPGAAAMTVLRISPRRDSTTDHPSGIAIVQVTDLGVAAKLGAEEAVVFVTTVHDGAPRAGASITLHDPKGRVRARGTTDAQGVALLRGFAPLDSTARNDDARGFEGYLSVRWNNDRTVVAFDRYSWELSPWRFNVSDAREDQRIPAAAAVFTERGIYRPGEVVHAKSIVRTGSLGALRAPQRGDSLRWVFYNRDETALKDTVVGASAFGTSDQALTIPADQALGTYRVGVKLKRGGEWLELATASYRIAEYRPPEFLVTVSGDTANRYAGDTLVSTIEARYLFGAPMARTPVDWTLRRTAIWPWELRIPNADEWEVGDNGSWWDDESDTRRVETLASGTDTLDAAGRAVIRKALGSPRDGKPARVTLEARVTDVNRQVVASTATATVHPASFYVGAKPAGDAWFWRAGTPVQVDLVALRPDGRRVPGVAVHGVIARREWHRVQRRREGVDERVGEWVSDTVAQCDATTAEAPVPCRFTPEAGGTYQLTFSARDGAGRTTTTTFVRWATGRGWVPWGDETQFKMDVIPDRRTYDVGDTATVLFASPFTDAEALITVEREGLIEHRRVRITQGATSLQFPVTEAYVPNAFVSIVVVRGRSAPAGGIADPGRPALRVGYAELTVTPSVKRLRVEVQPRAREYQPGDSARVQVRVRDSRGAGRRSEVTLWAVDEGVLSLTGYRTPDPIELLYEARGVGMRLASSMTAIAAQVLDSEGVSIKGDRAPGGGGGLESGDVLRSRFASTAFFLGSVMTNDSGDAEAVAKLPDNLTTFRVMAVAVTPGDRYGNGESPMLVTRPLLARPALPRFLRRDDRLVAGVVVNQRAGGTPTVRVRANVRGVVLTETTPLKSATLAAGRGTEVRFAMRDTTDDVALLRFDVSNGRDSDAVLMRLPVRSAFTPRTYTAAGVARLTTSAELALPADIDPVRSRLVFGIGTTPLALLGGMYRQLAVYPFDCTEQVASEMLPLAAMLRAGGDALRYLPANARAQLEEGVRTITRRQRPDGSIGLWSGESWSTPWLTSYAGEALLAAREAGIPVRDTVLAAIGSFLKAVLHEPVKYEVPVIKWLDLVPVRLAEQAAAADFLSRTGRPDIPAENELLRAAGQMAWEDRLRLAQMLARRGQSADARRLLDPLWQQVRVEGRRATLPDTAYRSFYFWSTQRPVARLLQATLAVDPGSRLIGPLVESLVELGRGARWWNTQDYGSAAAALADFTARQQRAVRRGYTVAAAGQVLFRSTGEGPQEFTRALTGLLVPGPNGTNKLTVTVAAPAADDAPPLYFHVSVQEVPRVRPVTPDEQGIAVERWYEDFATGRPITSIVEGSLVRVRLRITITAERSFLALTDPLPAGLEAVDLSLRTAASLPGPDRARRWYDAPDEDGEGEEMPDEGPYRWGWFYGSWDSGWWSPFDHRELRDDRVAWVATYLWPGTYMATYVARATTPGVFVRPPAYAEEMYNPSVQGRSDGGVFTVTRRTAR